MENERLRQTLSALLQELGMERIQKSVFVGVLSEARYGKLLDWLDNKFTNKNKVKDKTFSVFIINLSPTQIERSQHLGTSELDWEYMLGQTYTLYL